MAKIAAWRPSPQWWPYLLFLGAVAVRLVYLLQGHQVPAQDTPDYDDIALNLLRGEGFVARQNWFGFELRSWRPPFYPFFLAMVYGAFGYSHLPVLLLQAAVGAGTAVLVYGLGRALCPPAALIAGTLAVLYGPLVSSAVEVMSETWFTFWVVLSARLLVGRPAGRRSALGGAAVGLAALTRPAGLFLWPAFALVALVRRGGEGVRPLLWASVGVAVVLLPWTWRNWQVHGALVPISTQGGFIMARSNAAQPDWRQEKGWGIPRAAFEQIPSEVERDRHWQREAFSFIRSHPGVYLRLVGERFLRFWYFLRPEYNLWFMAVLPFCAAGLWRFWNSGDFLLLTGFIGISVAGFSLLLYGSTRFRLPLEPLFLLYAASWVRHGWDTWDQRRFWGLIGGVAGLNLLLYWQDAAWRALLLEWLRAWGLK